MADRDPDRLRSLEELEGDDWGPGAPSDTSLVRTCHALRKRPIGELDVEDLRVMIGQRMGLPFLVPLALEMLEEDPLAEGDYYPGDLLRQVLGIDASFWNTHSELGSRLTRIAASVTAAPPEVAAPLADFLRWSGRAVQ